MFVVDVFQEFLYLFLALEKTENIVNISFVHSQAIYSIFQFSVFKFAQEGIWFVLTETVRSVAQSVLASDPLITHFDKLTCWSILMWFHINDMRVM